MIITILTWLIMGGIFCIYGIAINFVVKRCTKFAGCDFFDFQWFGIIVVTVFAQFFSLVYKIGCLAFVGISAGAVLLLLLLRKEYVFFIKERINGIKVSKEKSIYCIVIFFVILFVGCIFTIQMPKHYDTYLYHAQNIRWIEKFGVVKGLGNFHNRFAYNSSFLCLQALFSFVWCLDQSLHTLNGFLWIFMMSYAVCTLKIFKEKKVFLSDFFKFLTLTYLVNDETIRNLSSPHTDLMTMFLVIYIITRWVDYTEQGEKNYIPYGLLCLLGVFSVSVKLSGALILILVVKPAVELLKEKNWKTIAGFIMSGVFIIAPFLVRNIILSGYLIYPYEGIDLFNVDWKMPASQVVFDNHEIIAWGRMLNDVERYYEPITVWLPLWLENCANYIRCIMIFNIILVPIAVGSSIYKFYKKKYNDCLVLLCCIVLFCGWLFTAPLPRYGTIYMYLLPSICGFEIAKKVFSNSLGAWGYVVCACFVAVGMGAFQMAEVQVECLKYGNRLYPMDYNENYSVELVSWQGIDVYIPNTGDQVSYNVFPSLPYAMRLELIELRGEDLDDGFRIKEEYKNRAVNTYGGFMD